MPFVLYSFDEITIEYWNLGIWSGNPRPFNDRVVDYILYLENR